MNYYEHHLGDYDGATAHLSWHEDCAYRRLICLYYRNESPIPADTKQACRLVRASSKAERDAVQQVLAEFFHLEADGWHHKRCDADLERYRETIPDREARRENDRERQRRARERRKTLFDTLRECGIVPPFDAKTSELESMLSRATSRTVTRDMPHTVTRDNTATQTPDTRHQSSEAIASSERRRGSRLPTDWQPEPDADLDRLLAPARRIAELAKFRDFWAAKAGKDGAKLDWQATWRNWLRKAAESHGSNGAQTESFRERDLRLASERVAAFTGRPAASQQPIVEAEVIDVTPRVLGR